MSFLNALSQLYESKHYKWYPVIVLLIALLCAFLVLVSPGLKPGIDLTGGVVMVFKTSNSIDSQSVLAILNGEEFLLKDTQVQSVSSPLGSSVRISFSQPDFLIKSQSALTLAQSVRESDPAQAIALARQVQNEVSVEKPFSMASSVTASEAIEAAKVGFTDAKESFNNRLQKRLASHLKLESNAAFQRSEIAPVIGQTFWQGALLIALLSAVFLVIAVFILFRELVPSLAIILAMVFDVLVALAGMSVFNIPLSLATIPTLLMIVGYSVDTDILLTTRLVSRKEGKASARAYDSMVTGLSMTATGLVSILVMLVLSYFAQIDVMLTIASVLLFGLLGDIVSTWLMNAPVLLMYMQSKEAKHQGTAGGH